MNLRKLTALAVMALMVAAPATPAFAVSKEIIQLQTQVQDLADRMAHMQQSFDERMGVMRSLVEQSTDNVNKLSESMQTMQKSLQQQSTDSQAKIDQVSGQIQTLNDSIDELKARLAKTSKQLDDIQNQQQNLTPPAPAAGAHRSARPAPAAACRRRPPTSSTTTRCATTTLPATIWRSRSFRITSSTIPPRIWPATRSSISPTWSTAPETLRPRSTDYDKVLEQFPGGNKAAAAQLKKGYSLLELGRKDAGVRELNALIQRYPHAIEATQARERLHKLGASSARPVAHKVQ